MDNAELYSQNNKMQQKAATEVLETYEPKFTWKKTKNRILDVGSGDGIVSTILKNYVPRDFTLVGCDLQESMVTFANSKYRDEKTSFVVLDIAGDITEDMKESFSHIFSFFALNCIRDQESTLKNIYNMLEPGGECILNIVAYSAIYDVYRSLISNPKWSTLLYSLEKYLSPYHDVKAPEGKITKMMKDIGFDNILVEHKEIYYIFHDMEEMKNTLRAFNPCKIPNEMYEDFWNDAFKLLKKIGSKIYGSDYLIKDYKYTYNTIIVHAQKLPKQTQ